MLTIDYIQMTSYLNRISGRIVHPETTLIQCLKTMDDEKTKLLFVFNDKDSFIGLLTIGDIQRAIIRNISLTAQIETILDTDKIFGKENESLETLKNTMIRERLECLPILKSNGEMTDVLFWEDVFPDKEIQVRDKINLPVVIMAGGEGTRLRPLTHILPKPLIPIGEKTIMEVIMEQFQSIGCSKFYVSVNYKAELIEYYLSHNIPSFDISFFKENRPLGTIGSVSLLKGKIDTPFFVTNCDIMVDQDFRDVYEYHVNNHNDITIVAAIKSYQIPYGVIETADNGILMQLTEKPKMNLMVNTGVYVLNPELIAEIPSDCMFHMTDLMEKIRKRGGQIGCFPVSEKSWKDIGEWDEYLKTIRLHE